MTGLDHRARTVVVIHGKGGKGGWFPTARRRPPRWTTTCARARGDVAALWSGTWAGRSATAPGLRSGQAADDCGRRPGGGEDRIHAALAPADLGGQVEAGCGSEAGLMAVVAESIARYVKASSQRLAAEEARRLDLGNL